MIADRKHHSNIGTVVFLGFLIVGMTEDCVKGPGFGFITIDLMVVALVTPEHLIRPRFVRFEHFVLSFVAM